MGGSGSGWKNRGVGCDKGGGTGGRKGAWAAAGEKRDG
jgi:hypothetical protein